MEGTCTLCNAHVVQACGILRGSGSLSAPESASVNPCQGFHRSAIFTSAPRTKLSRTGKKMKEEAFFSCVFFLLLSPLKLFPPDTFSRARHYPTTFFTIALVHFSSPRNCESRRAARTVEAKNKSRITCNYCPQLVRACKQCAGHRNHMESEESYVSMRAGFFPAAHGQPARDWPPSADLSQQKPLTLALSVAGRALGYVLFAAQISDLSRVGSGFHRHLPLLDHLASQSHPKR